MIDLTTYALLREQIASVASGVSDVRAEGDELIFVLADGREVRVAIPATEIRNAEVRDDVLVLTLADGSTAVAVDATLTQSGQAADAKATGEALAGKLDNTPGTWPAWTADEQAAARERMGIYEYQLINDITVAEDITELMITRDQDGNSYNLKKFIVIMRGFPENTGKSYFRIDAWTKENPNLFVKYMAATQNIYIFLSYEAISPYLFRVDSGVQDNSSNIFTKGCSDICNKSYNGRAINDTNITKIHFQRNSSTDTIQAGINIKIYGVRA